MNYYQARELTNKTGWHFTVHNDGKTWPVGYCVGHAPHGTKEEAEACYAKFLIDTRLRLQDERPMCKHDTVCSCKECGALTVLGAFIDDDLIPLCKEHRTREFVEKHWIPPTQRFGSW
jgi:hypothetical protein